MTRVVKIDKTGGPEVLKFETITLDKPGLDEVVIEHRAIGLNFIDTYHRSGLYPLEVPSGIGGEAAGVIKEVGSKVKDFSPGDKVAYAGAPLGAYSSERIYPLSSTDIFLEPVLLITVNGFILLFLEIAHKFLFLSIAMSGTLK